ncbi:SSP120 (YLR250W) [Zygosaccharomyces parabailii]|uniref:ZYBA0S06-01068g1_1 n=1 Tax=Zygosaccharomyces bailii (strain CLIB 213 / ATCC 58445 / CBS 680 / BCRC 21525 / NBRC 1098 / NCYC 1416 / NRRL Y-2227) TaxID=1333698 RepID=A0A8J2T9W0_ZYGB2|nr:SSP120 (YLR250W) [Zygosaccharomyces parabailii]CDF90123.1 ZYBA0S06-01068g1_1 [Zygosaccharomyces bailii CLIB 213]CDH16656.1 probable protein SSP120 [Zygosaccharomyces bailii ISA1307]
MKFASSLLIGLFAAAGLADVNLSPDPKVNVEVERPPEGLSWEQWHMQHEHQLDEYTPDLFFSLHDNGGKGYLSKDDVLSLYGMDRGEVVGSGDGMGHHDDSEEVDKDLGNRIYQLIMRLLDVDDDSKITKEEYLDFARRGGIFPDLGVGVGHHADFEMEYEIHHWNEYHKDKDPDVSIIHKEDIEHELLHHEHEIEHEETVQRGASRATVITDDELEFRINSDVIPKKYKNSLF